MKRQFSVRFTEKHEQHKEQKISAVADLRPIENVYLIFREGPHVTYSKWSSVTDMIYLTLPLQFKKAVWGHGQSWL
jgi:hypothetical protein